MGDRGYPGGVRSSTAYDTSNYSNSSISSSTSSITYSSDTSCGTSQRAGGLDETDREVAEALGTRVSVRIRPAYRRQLEGGCGEHYKCNGHGPSAAAQVGSFSLKGDDSKRYKSQFTEEEDLPLPGTSSYGGLTSCSFILWQGQGRRLSCSH